MLDIHVWNKKQRGTGFVAFAPVSPWNHEENHTEGSISVSFPGYKLRMPLPFSLKISLPFAWTPKQKEHIRICGWNFVLLFRWTLSFRCSALWMWMCQRRIYSSDLALYKNLELGSLLSAWPGERDTWGSLFCCDLPDEAFKRGTQHTKGYHFHLLYQHRSTDLCGLCLKVLFKTTREYHSILLNQSDEFPITSEHMEGKSHTEAVSSQSF